MESLNVHADYVTEYALTLGKSSQGVNNFKNSIASLTDKSKLISTNAPVKALQNKLQLPRVYSLHASLHEKVLQLASLLSNEVNSEFGSLFSEKKYKELISIAKD